MKLFVLRLKNCTPCHLFEMGCFIIVIIIIIIMIIIVIIIIVNNFF